MNLINLFLEIFWGKKSKTCTGWFCWRKPSIWGHETDSSIPLPSETTFWMQISQTKSQPACCLAAREKMRRKSEIQMQKNTLFRLNSSIILINLPILPQIIFSKKRKRWGFKLFTLEAWRQTEYPLRVYSSAAHSSWAGSGQTGTQPKTHTGAMGTQSHHRDPRDSALAQAGGKLKYSKVRCRYFNY